MRIAVIQHSVAAGPAALERWLGEHQVSVYQPYAGAPLPKLEDFELLVLLGGSLSVHDERSHAWLAEEKRLIHRALLARKRVFGTEFGAQLLAEALGARVSRVWMVCASVGGSWRKTAIAFVSARPHVAAASAGAALAA